MWDYDILYTRIEGSERNAIKYAVDNGEAGYIERGLRYRERIVEEGGTLLTQFPNFYGGVSSKRHLYMALLISIGEALFSHPEGIRTDEEITRLLSMKSEYPALWNQSTRMQLITNDDDKYYSVLHTSKDGTQEIISVFNFQNEEARINIPLSDVQMRNFKDVSTGEIFEYTDDFKITLPARGYRFFLLTNEAANVVIPSIDLSVTVYPNPVNEFLNVNIEISPPKSISIQLIDVLGRIYSESSNEIPVNEEYSTSINMLHLPSGLYFLRIGTNAQEITRKILRF